MSVSLLFWVLVGYVLIVGSCLFLNCVQDRSFNSLDLGLPSELFPDEAIVNPIARPSTLEGAFDGGSMSIYWRKGNGLATYHVWRYRRETEASNLFMVESAPVLYGENKDLSYQSSLADEFYVGCGNQPNFGYRCKMTARYQEYVVRFNSMIDQDMSIDMFNEVIIFIDEQMGRYLYEEQGPSKIFRTGVGVDQVSTVALLSLPIVDWWDKRPLAEKVSQLSPKQFSEVESGLRLVLHL